MRKSCELWMLLALVLFCIANSRAADDIKKDDDRRRVEKAEQWELAAQNRDLAASIQQAQADLLLVQAGELMKRKYATDAEQTQTLNAAGELQSRAGDLYGASVVNFDMAIFNRQKAIDEYVVLRDEQRQRNTRSKSETVKKDAMQACARAAEAYELAAESFAPENGDNSSRMSAVMEKAASWRENLAARK